VKRQPSNPKQQININFQTPNFKMAASIKSLEHEGLRLEVDLEFAV
jgi:hypothetical protein